MSFLVPTAAFLALTLPAIVALYFLRIRRPTRIVPALNLWPDQIRDRQANVPWQRLRFSWLLLLQLLGAAILVAAAVQPALSAGTSLASSSVTERSTDKLLRLRLFMPIKWELRRSARSSSSAAGKASAARSGNN